MHSPKKQDKWPKYKTLPAALALYLTVMSVYGWRSFSRDGKIWLFCLIVVIEVAIIVALFFLLRHQYRRLHRDDEDFEH